jgi:hypothetical protein
MTAKSPTELMRIRLRPGLNWNSEAGSVPLRVITLAILLVNESITTTWPRATGGRCDCLKSVCRKATYTMPLCISIYAGSGDPSLSVGLTRLLKSISPVICRVVGLIMSSFGEAKRLTYALLVSTKTMSQASVPFPTASKPFIGVMKPSCGSRT